MNNGNVKNCFRLNCNSQMLLLFLVLFISSCNNNLKKTAATQLPDTTPKTINHKMTGKELVYNLEKAGYFKYTDNDKLAFVQYSIIKHFETDKVFITEFNDKPPFQSYDLRFYDCADGESLFEEGGVISLIEEMRPFLGRSHITLNYSDDKYFNDFHSINVNGREYILANGGNLLWGETIANFVEMLNAELQIQHSTERLYLMTNENEYMMFLTQEQYDILAANLAFDKRPQTVNEWAKNKTDEINRMINN